MTDPILHLIEAHRALLAKANASASVADNRKANEAYDAVLEARPATAAGCAAVLRYVAEQEAELSALEPPVVDFMTRLAGAMEGVRA